MEIVKIKLNGGIMPQKATEGAAAFDLYVPEDVYLKEGRQLIDLKFSIELPYRYAATIQPRSGFSAKGMVVAIEDIYDRTLESDDVRINADVIRGLIDADFRGNVRVIIDVKESLDGYYYLLQKGTRIAQMQIVEVPQIQLVEVDELSETERGEGGIGSTGTR